MDKHHQSRVDSWVMVLGVSLAIFSLLFATLLALSGWGVMALLLLIVGCILPMWVLMDTSYHLINEQLMLRCGPLRWRIHLDRVVKVEPTHNWQPGPALSKERLIVHWRNQNNEMKHVLLSPEDRYAFIFDLGLDTPTDEDS